MSKGYKIIEIDEMDIFFWWDLFDEHQETNVIKFADGYSFI